MTTARLLIALSLATLATGCANTIDRTHVIDAPIEKVWKVLAVDYQHVDQWASSVPSSEPVYAPKADGAGEELTGRVCSTEIGGLSETILEFDEQAHVLHYEAQADGMPFFVSGLENRWTLTAESPTSTRVDMHFDADVWPVFNVIMWPLMKGNLADLLDESIEELDHYVETGKPHPRKVAALEKAKEGS